MEKAFESKVLKVNLMKTKVVVSGLKGKILKSKVDPCAKNVVNGCMLDARK